MSFEEAVNKIREHYGLEICASMVQRITKCHAKKIATMKPAKTANNTMLIIAEVDGGMVPIVEMEQKATGDLRKTRKVGWKEAKLCFARPSNKIDRIYAAVIGTPEEAGQNLYECAQRAGLVETTYVHAVSDGAPWIVDQIESQFGAQAHFLIDFFHVCEYLSEASLWCNVLDTKGWLEEKKKMLKAGRAETLFHELKTKLNGLEKVTEDNGLAKCVQYMEKRLKYMDYEKAREKELPIGSGEIESSHRHVVQKRLKIAGAWWKTENANYMLQLRTARANNCWKAYWKESKAA